jgi:beta-galactosidase
MTILPSYPHILHGGDYNPDQWLDYPQIIDDDFRLMKLAGCNTFSVGIFAWTSYEPEEGKFTFAWLDRIMDRMALAGNRVILATPSGAKPNWMAAKYPEIRRVNRQDLREPQRGRHNHCWTSPIYREKVHIINTKLAERYKGHPALGMWHLSNEYNGECVCELCLASWQNWLKQKYGTLDALNHAWWTYFWSHPYTAWEQIIPHEGHHEGLNLDWMRFLTGQVADFFRWETAPLKAITPGIPCTTNFMGYFNGLDYGRLADEMDIIADDQYPAYDGENPDLVKSAIYISFKDDLYRCFKPDKPFMLMESCPDSPQWKKPQRLKQPGLHQVEMLQALGHGAEGTCYFQWRKGRGGMEKFHGAVVDHNNHENTRVFQAVADLGKFYEKLTPILGSRVQSQVALIYDWEVRWAFSFCDGPASQNDAYDRVCNEHYAPFWAQGISMDVLHSERDFSNYKLVIAPQLWMLKPGVAQKLRQYVENGGTLVTTYYTGIVDETDLIFMGGWPGAGLMDVFGVWNEETDVLRAAQIRSVNVDVDNPLGLQGPYQAQNVCGLVQLRGAQALATYGDGFYAGTPAITVNAFGKGQVYYQAAQLTPDSQCNFYGALIQQLGLQRPFQAGLPDGVTCQVRHKDDQAFYFIENFTPEAQTITLDAGTYTRLSGDAATGAALVGTFTLAPFGSDVLAK